MAGSSLTRLVGALLVNDGGYTLTAQHGTYALSGQTAGIRHSRALTLSSGSYALTGQSATITYTPAIVGYTLTALAGSYSLSGRTAALSKGRALTAQSGAYSLSGRTVTLLKSRRIQATQGSYSVAGRSATLTYTPNAAAYLLTGLAGSYSLSGQAATITKASAAAYVLTALAGSYSLAGQSAQITASGQAPGPQHEVEIIDYEPKLWWLRKPKAVAEDDAREKVAQVATVIREVVREQVADVSAWPAYKPTKAQKTQVRQAIAPLVANMPGFDWVALYSALLMHEAAKRQAAREAWERDEEDALILLMAA